MKKKPYKKKKDQSMCREKDDISNVLNAIKGRVDQSIQRINIKQNAEEDAWTISLEEAIYYYSLAEFPPNFYPTDSYAEVRRLVNKGNENDKSTWRNVYSTAHTQLKEVLRLFAVSADQLFHRGSTFQLNSMQYRFVHELLARRNNIYVWNQMVKEYTSSYAGLLNLYYKLEDGDRQSLIDELKFMIKGLTAIKKPSSLPEKEFKNHLLAVTQLPLIEIANIGRKIASIDMRGMQLHPNGLKLIDYYNNNIIQLHENIQMAIIQANYNLVTAYVILSAEDPLLPTEDGNDYLLLDRNSLLAESISPQIVEEIKKIDARYKSAKTLEELQEIDDEYKENLTRTEKKKLDGQNINIVKKAISSHETEDEY